MRPSESPRPRQNVQGPSRRRRWLLGILAAILTLGVVLSLVVFFAPLRAAFLRHAIRLAGDALPGDLHVSRARWPGLERLVLNDVTWKLGSRLLLRADSLDLNVSLGALTRRELEVRQIRLQGLTLDAPALAEAFDSRDSEPAEPRRGWSFLRPGSIPGIPSLALHHLVVQADSIRLHPQWTAGSVAIEGQCDLRNGRPPRLRLRRFQAFDPRGVWRVDTLALEIDLEKGRAEGRGRGHLEPQEPLFFDLNTLEPDVFSLRLGEASRAAPNESVGLAAHLHVMRRGLELDSLRVEGDLRTPGPQRLARFMRVAPQGVKLPDLESLRMAVNGTLALRPVPDLHLEARLQPNTWISGALEYDRRPEEWKIELRDLAVTGVLLDGTLRSTRDGIEASTSLSLTGPGWQEWMAQPLSPLEDLRLQSRLQMRSSRRSDEVQIEWTATGGSDDFNFDSLRVQGIVSPRGISKLQLQASAGRLHAGLGTEIALGSTIRLRCSPLFLENRAVAPSRLQQLSESPTVLYETDGRHLQVKDFRVDGAAGRALLQGDIVLGGPAQFGARIDWPRFPEFLSSAWALEEAPRDSLRQLWQRDGPFGADLEGHFDAHGASGEISGHFVLPGPSTLAPVLPATPRQPPRGPVILDGELSKESAGNPSRYSLVLDGSSTAWLDSLQLQLEGDMGTARVQRALLQLDDARLVVGGDIGQEALNLRGSLDVTSFALLNRFLVSSQSTSSSSLADSLRAMLVHGELSVTGPRDELQVLANLHGATRWGRVEVPQWTSEIRRDAGETMVTFDGPEGGSLPFLELDRIQGKVEIPPDASQPWSLWLRAQGSEMEFEQTARIVADSGWSMDVENLRLALGAGDLRSQGPFRIGWNPRRLQLEHIQLAGSLGRIDANGVASAGGTSMEASISVALPEKPAALRIPKDLWPRQVELQARGQGIDSLSAHGVIRGFRLAGGAQPTLQVRLQAEAGRAEAELTLGDGAPPSVRGRLGAPIRLRLYPPSLRLEMGPIATDLQFTDLPMVVRPTATNGFSAAESILHLAGHVRCEGETSSPAGFVTLKATLPDSPRLSPYQLQCDARFGTGPLVDSLWAASAGTDESDRMAPLQVRLRLLDDASEVLRGGLDSPLRIALRGQSLEIAGGEPITAWIRAEDVPLSSSNPFLPGGVMLGGSGTLWLDLTGPVRNPALEGHLKASGVELTFHEGSTVTLQGTTTLGGNAESPRLAGTIDVLSGVLKVPESSKNLHPVSGEALLLEARGAPRDSLRHGRVSPSPGAADHSGSKAPVQNPAPPAPGILERADLDVTIRIGNGFALRGRGMDLEVSGQLRIQQRNGEPRVVGELGVVRGTYSLLGRTFNLDRGRVDFRADEAYPVLDVQLSTTVSGTRIRVLVSGTTEKPQLTLSSDPEMEETDIVALLTIGKTFDSLNEQESTLLRDRAAAVVLSMGAAALQENVAHELGIDIVQYRSTGGPPAASSSRESDTGSLAFGKYLNPRLLLSYAYSLNRSTDDLVSLEYFLKSELRIETLVSVGGETGMGFVWSKEY